ncbi:MAG: class I SAM-dependent methyltransferase, partial [Acidimicrobiales bacterium]
PAPPGAQGPVLEIGCGQGSLLTLLAERQVPASGAELDRDLVEGCCARGLTVVADDGLDVLARVPAGSLGAVVAIHVVEHLTPQRLSELVVMACEKLRPGGWLVMETPNPQSLYVFARSFFLDPTHQAPVHPAYLEFLVREAGFGGARIEWLSPVSEDEALLDDGTENSRRIASVLFAPQDYRLYAVR